MTDLPPPVDGTQQYLAAVHDRIGETNTLLARIIDRFTPAEEPPPAGTVELREPAVPERPAPGARQKTKTTSRPRAGATRKET